MKNTHKSFVHHRDTYDHNLDLTNTYQNTKKREEKEKQFFQSEVM